MESDLGFDVSGMCGVVIGRRGGLRELQFLEGFYFL
jgi:hypothetical protein